jgi:hypothetical protein
MRYWSLIGATGAVFFGVISDSEATQAFDFALAVLNFGLFLHPITKGFRDGP